MLYTKGMFMIWSIISNEIIFADSDKIQENKYMLFHGVFVEISGNYGNYRLERLLSSNPKDFLQKSFQPGVYFKR